MSDQQRLSTPSRDEITALHHLQIALQRIEQLEKELAAARSESTAFLPSDLTALIDAGPRDGEGAREFARRVAARMLVVRKPITKEGQ